MGSSPFGPVRLVVDQGFLATVPTSVKDLAFIKLGSRTKNGGRAGWQPRASTQALVVFYLAALSVSPQGTLHPGTLTWIPEGSGSGLSRIGDVCGSAGAPPSGSTRPLGPASRRAAFGGTRTLGKPFVFPFLSPTPSFPVLPPSSSCPPWPTPSPLPLCFPAGNLAFPLPSGRRFSPLCPP